MMLAEHAPGAHGPGAERDSAVAPPWMAAKQAAQRSAQQGGSDIAGVCDSRRVGQVRRPASWQCCVGLWGWSTRAVLGAWSTPQLLPVALMPSVTASQANEGAQAQPALLQQALSTDGARQCNRPGGAAACTVQHASNAESLMVSRCCPAVLEVLKRNADQLLELKKQHIAERQASAHIHAQDDGTTATRAH